MSSDVMPMVGQDATQKYHTESKTRPPHPLEQVQWEKRHGVLGSLTIESPVFWSEQSVTIATRHYLTASETSIRQLIQRVVSTITNWGVTDGVFNAQEARQFDADLSEILVYQKAAFNSPVWFNVGVQKHPLCNACFIQQVDDNMDSITDLLVKEARIFKRGAGTGCNHSNLRSSKEKVQESGFASGPVSFMKGYDAFASVIKSGGKLRRAARMDQLHVSHPDIRKFIQCKVKAEKMARALVAAGWSTDMNDEDSIHNVVPFQSTNNTVRITDDFMRAVENGEMWELRAVKDPTRLIDKVSARELMREIAEAAWFCGDPGVQFHDTINKWSTISDVETIWASNPCGEYVGVNNSACNLASINLYPGRPLQEDELEHIIEVLVVAMDLICTHSACPTETIYDNAQKYRPLGLGWANLGGLLMAKGVPYDSDEARDIAATIASFTTAKAYEASFKLASKSGAFPAAEEARDSIVTVLKAHVEMSPVKEAWEPVLKALSAGRLPRNSAVTLCAPTGTIGYLMGCDTTGIECFFSLVSDKKLSYGGNMTLMASTIESGLIALGYKETEAIRIAIEIRDKGYAEEAVKSEHLPVFDTAIPSGPSKRCIHHNGHINMLAAIQPHVSMAISKTVNLPGDATAEEIEGIYKDAWRKGIKCLSVYRDTSKVSQPLTSTSKGKNGNGKHMRKIEAEARPQPVLWGERRRLPDERKSITKKFSIDGTEGYLIVGMYEDGTPGEIFIDGLAEGTLISGLADCFAKAMSMALQFGCPLDVMLSKLKGLRFEPQGWTQDQGFAKSLADYIAKWMNSKWGVESDPKVDIILTETTKGDNGQAHKGMERCQCGGVMIPTGPHCKTCRDCGEGQGGCS